MRVRTMNKRMIMLMAAALALLSAAAGQISFTGGSIDSYHVIEVQPAMTTGLNMIYVIYDTQGVSMTYTASSNETVTWQSFESRGGGYAEPVTGITRVGNVTTLHQVLGDMGYIITEGTTPNYVWVVNYADHRMELNDMFFDNEESCDLLKFNIDAEPDIPYYTITGVHQLLDRELTLHYNNLEWNATSYSWEEVEVTDTFPSLDQVVIDPPLCSTGFKLKGDRYLKEWNLPMQEIDVDIEYYEPRAVSCHAEAYQDFRGNPNEKGNDANVLGGSAPCHIVFTGYPTSGVTFSEWQMATDDNFENIIMRFPINQPVEEHVEEYTFENEGTFYMRYHVAHGSCEAFTEDDEVFRITVGVQDLQCPNFFSPGTTPRVNDKWMVSYQSLIEFHCWIFNRWGNLVFEFTDPGEGWDGTYRGKQVDPGVYYYVITYTGSDGVKRKKSGDINILHYIGTSGTETDNGGL